MKLSKSIVRRGADSSSNIDFPGIHPTLARIYSNRGVKNAEELDNSLSKLCLPHELSNLDTAVEIIIDAVMADACIIIAGDYDVDGATSCALSYLVLRAFGAKNVAYVCPDRHRFGYGLTEQFVQHFSPAAPDLVITVDNGITSIEGVKLAKQLGMTVIVTDHHLPSEELPQADAIVNPRLPGDKFKSKNLAGVGVIFYVLSVVRSKLIELNWFKDEGIAIPNMADYLDLVALGTVADVVPLDHNNRILVAQGLLRINSKRCRMGILALLEEGRRTIGQIVAEDLAFAVGPRLNAAGRLDDIRFGVRCLVSDNRQELIQLIEKLERFNNTRKEIEATMLDDALRAIQAIEPQLKQSQASICLFDKNWHPGIIGILASRIRERTGKPTIVFSKAEDGVIRGSGRSIRKLNLRDVIADVATLQPGIIRQFGGHAMAAGLTITETSFPEFARLYEKLVVDYTKNISESNVIFSDGEIESLDLQTAEAIQSGGPWGQGFEPPVFDGIFEVKDFRILKEKHVKMRIFSIMHSKFYEAIYFNYSSEFDTAPKLSHYQFVYQPQVQWFRGRKRLQLKTLYMQPC